GHGAQIHFALTNRHSDDLPEAFDPLETSSSTPSNFRARNSLQAVIRSMPIAFASRHPRKKVPQVWAWRAAQSCASRRRSPSYDAATPVSSICSAAVTAARNAIPAGRLMFCHAVTKSVQVVEKSLVLMTDRATLCHFSTIRRNSADFALGINAL